MFSVIGWNRLHEIFTNQRVHLLETKANTRFISTANLIPLYSKEITFVS